MTTSSLTTASQDERYAGRKNGLNNNAHNNDSSKVLLKKYFCAMVGWTGSWRLSYNLTEGLQLDGTIDVREQWNVNDW